MRTVSTLLLLAACQTQAPTTPQPDVTTKVEAPPPAAAPDARILGVFKPLPADMATADRPIDAARVDLGRMLYYDTRLSVNGELSCNSCHMLDKWGVDNQPTSPGHTGERGGRNSPTVYNAALHVAQFWDGREPDVEAQAKGPVLNPIEMGMPDGAAVEKVLGGIEGYGPLFAAAFPGQETPITFDNYAIAVGAFERTLVTPSRFDAYLNGDASALTPAEVEGAMTFMDSGCTACHMGATVGGNLYQKLGLIEPYTTADEGRKAVTGNDADLHVFKVPSLRNVAKTGPYFHDGSIGTLPEAVRLMARHQAGRQLDDQQVAQIVTFLESLTGELPTDKIAKPQLPGT